MSHSKQTWGNRPIGPIDIVEMILCSLALGGLLAGCTLDARQTVDYTPVPTTVVGSATPQDTKTVGRSNVDAQEVIEPAGLHELIADLTQYEPETFAGLWVQNEPEYRILVAFTHDGKETISKYVENTPLAGMVAVQAADFSLAELLAAGEEVGQIVRQLGFPFTWILDLQKNRVKLLATDRARFEAALEDAGLELPQCVEMIVVYEPSVHVPPGITPVPDVAFPQLRARSTIHLDMPTLRGELVIENGCLRVRQSDGPSRLIIWQPDYFLSNNRGTIEIVDSEGQVMWRVGEQIALGLADAANWEDQLRDPLPERCSEPYWIMDEIVY